MIPEMNDLRAPSRIASAAGALVITSVILLAIGLGFSTRVSAQAIQSQASAPVAARTPPAVSQPAPANQGGPG